MADSNQTGLAAGAAWVNGTVSPIAETRLPINDWGIDSPNPSKRPKFGSARQYVAYQALRNLLIKID